ncbi:MAG: hypothetical protein AVDCRST_MAG40-2832, partial [uncultured Gemmatimonadaceae bacterium]
MRKAAAFAATLAAIAATQGCAPAASRPQSARAIAAPAPSRVPAHRTTEASRPAAPLAAKGYQFAEVPFGISAARVTAMLEKRGYTSKGVDQDGDHMFLGSMMGAETMVYAMMSEGRLARVLVIVGTDDADARPTYAKMRETLLGKYGRPDLSIEEYDRPFRAGDGREDEAVKKGKARITTVWRPTANSSPSLGIRVTK